jgi:hypothetical protein
VQRIAAVAACGGIVLRGFVELVRPGLARLMGLPCPAKFLELAGQFPAWIRVNALRRGEHHLHLGETAIPAEMSIAAVADRDGVLAGDLRQRTAPPAPVRFFLAIDPGRLAGPARRAVGASRSPRFLKCPVSHRPTVCLASGGISSQDCCLRCAIRPHLPEGKRASYSPGGGRCQSVRHFRKHACKHARLHESRLARFPHTLSIACLVDAAFEVGQRCEYIIEGERLGEVHVSHRLVVTLQSR